MRPVVEDPVVAIPSRRDGPEETAEDPIAAGDSPDAADPGDHPDVRRAREPARRSSSGRSPRRPTNVHVLVVDDHSPDGTGDVADELALYQPRVHVLHRTAKSGLGPAYLAGIRLGGRGRATTPSSRWTRTARTLRRTCPRLLAALVDHDLVLGSRWVPGGRTERWPLRRQWLSRAGNRYARIALGIDVRDATGGFRAFRTAALGRIDLSGVASQGYCFQVDLVWKALVAGPLRDRGADRLHRAGRGPLEDEQQHRRGGAAPRHRLGTRPPAAGAARARAPRPSPAVRAQLAPGLSVRRPLAGAAPRRGAPPAARAAPTRARAAAPRSRRRRRARRARR